MKKICIVSVAIKMGGIERESVNLANSLSPATYDVSFFALFKRNHFFKLNDHIDFHEPLDFNIHKLHFYKTLAWLRDSITAINPDSVLVYGKFNGAIVSLALLNTGYPVFISEAASPVYNWGFMQGSLNRLAYSLRPPAGVKAQTHVSYEYLKKYYSEKTRIQVIPNPVRPVELYPEEPRKKWILGVGRFGDHLKGFDRLIVAFSKIKAKDWTLVFAGGDEDGQYLKDQAASLGVLDRILFLGQVSDIDKVYAQGGIFVIPSRSEGFPNALCEAMAAGLPCIAFDFISGPRDMIKPGYNGIIVKEGDTDALAVEIDGLIADEQRRVYLGKNALEVREWLEKDKISREVMAFIEGAGLPEGA